MKLSLSLIVVCIFGCAIGGTGCREAPQPNTGTLQAEKMKAASSTPSYATTSFDLTASSLPVDYKGHDIESVCHLAEYPNGKRFDGLYAFRLESRLDDQDNYSAPTFALKLTYKAHLVHTLSLETVSIQVWGETSKDPWAPLGFVTGVIIKSRSFSSHYTGQNAFSAKISVTKLDGEQFNIAIDKAPRPVTVNLEVGRLRDVLFICKLKPPLFHKGYRHTDPTFTDPFDVSITHKVLYVDLKAIWIYDPPSGEILRKYDTH